MSRQQKSSIFPRDVNDCMAGMKSETQDALESGAKQHSVRPEVLKKIVHFRSFKSNQYSQDKDLVPRVHVPPISVYTKDYSRSSHSSKLRQCIAEKDIPDPDFCRRPVNPFYSLSSSQFKFMDDHHSKDLETEYRKKINFFRQLRHQSQIFTD